MYSAIKLTDDISKIYKPQTGKEEIANLSRVNIFIGPNNSGKSRFLRALFVNEKPYFKVENVDLAVINKAVESFLHCLRSILNTPQTRLEEFGVNPDAFKINSNGYLSDDVDLKKMYDEGNRIINSADLMSKNLNLGRLSYREIDPEVRKYANNFLIDIRGNDIENYNQELYKKKNYYIPTLRGLRGVSYSNNQKEPNDSDGYKIRTINDYFKDNNEIEDKIYTGLGLYNDVKRLLLGVSSEREKIKNFETFLSETFFDRKDVSIIPHIDSNVVYVKIGDDDDRPIYNLGEGIQSIIILTYPLFINQGENINFFFEEPDLFLHPGFQRIFLETLNDKRFSSFQYFFTTHSNHFLDMTLDFSETSVYSFHRVSKEEFKIENIKNADKDILHALGARNSSVFLSNCTIWVEGITDRIYIKKYLEVLMNEKQKVGDKVYKEDIHYSFVEYGGNNITHWSFLEDDDENHPNIEVESLCGQLFLISDSDNASKSSKKYIRQEKLKEKLGEHFYCLEVKEIENLLTPKVIIETIKKFEKNDCEGVDFKTILNDKYQNHYLGKYIQKNVDGLKRVYESKSGTGTIANKVQFAKVASAEITEWNDISEEAKKLVGLLYDFIAENNK